MEYPAPLGGISQTKSSYDHVTMTPNSSMSPNFNYGYPQNQRKHETIDVN